MATPAAQPKKQTVKVRRAEERANVSVPDISERGLKATSVAALPVATAPALQRETH